MSRVAHSLLWDGPPLPPAPSYGVGVFERKERANDHRDPWNRPGQEPEQHCWPGCGGTGRPAPTRETGDPCRTCQQAPTLHGCYVDRRRVVTGKSVLVRVKIGGRG